MARTVELSWHCSQCATRNIRGRHKRCPDCGSAREKGEMKMDGLGAKDYDAKTGRNKAKTVTDPALLAAAAIGADWFCSHCEAGNKGNGNKCSTCAAPRYATAEENHPEFQTDHLAHQARIDKGEIPSPDGRPLEEPKAKSPPPLDTPEEEVRKRTVATAAVGGVGIAAIVAIVVGILLIVGSLIWALQTHKVIGTVAGMSWDRTIYTEQWTDTTSRLWKHKTSERPEIAPRNGSGEQAGRALMPSSCRQEHYENERYVCGSHEECVDIYRTERESYTCTKSERYVCGETCRDNGNGFATCHDKYCSRSVSDTCYRDKKVFDRKKCETVKDYCTRPIYKDKCDYLTQEWRTASSYPTHGSGKEFVWGNAPVADEIRATYSASYVVTVQYTDGGETERYEITSSTHRDSRYAAEKLAADYLTWTLGDSVDMDINNLGGVHNARHLVLEKP